MKSRTLSPSVFSWMRHFLVLHPPDGVLYVGAGTGAGRWVQLLLEEDVPNVTLVEADDGQFVHLKRSIAGHEGWDLQKRFIAANAGTATFHVASQSAESGLLDPARLHGLWPNLKSRAQLALPTTTLERLQQGAALSANWLVVDCLPALPILQSAADKLDRFDVITLRTLFDSVVPPEVGASLSELTRFLCTRGYRCIATEAGRHPLIGHVIFVKDFRFLLSALQQQSTETFLDFQAEKKRLMQNLKRLGKLAEEKENNIDKIANEKTAAEIQAIRIRKECEILRRANARMELMIGCDGERYRQSSIANKKKTEREKLRTGNGIHPIRIDSPSGISSGKQEFSSAKYWNDRYLKGGNSGYGSYGRLAEFKARIINEFIQNNKIEKLIEFGCGDGNQLGKFSVGRYIGVDISPAIIQVCKDKFSTDPGKSFLVVDDFIESSDCAELTLSLDVIFHLVEDDLFERYMSMLFRSSTRFVLIYSCEQESVAGDEVHLRRRRFTNWIDENLASWRLIDFIRNDYPSDGERNSKYSSFSDFYFYELQQQ
ncbi:class I SAM-dependent methyltransferase [Cupriavidus basilensis]|uniref:class I SAM-dependent methyltransferase n=1 Tax=Cupriavidus basilensis TaxID=68895 RepID=UPI000AC4EAD0|nr:class I SAM-dependent methyltransferase [Cupriavidus basilensis]